MADYTGIIQQLINAFKAHAPAIAGAIFSSKRVKIEKNIFLCFIRWLAINGFGFFLAVVLSIYLGDYMQATQQLNDNELYVFKLFVGLFGFKLYNYIDEKIEPLLDEVFAMFLQKIKRILGVKDDD